MYSLGDYHLKEWNDVYFMAWRGSTWQKFQHQQSKLCELFEQGIQTSSLKTIFASLNKEFKDHYWIDNLKMKLLYAFKWEGVRHAAGAWAASRSLKEPNSSLAIARALQVAVSSRINLEAITENMYFHGIIWQIVVHNQPQTVRDFWNLEWFCMVARSYVHPVQHVAVHTACIHGLGHASLLHALNVMSPATGNHFGACNHPRMFDLSIPRKCLDWASTICNQADLSMFAQVSRVPRRKMNCFDGLYHSYFEYHHPFISNVCAQPHTYERARCFYRKFEHEIFFTSTYPLHMTLSRDTGGRTEDKELRLIERHFYCKLIDHYPSFFPLVHDIQVGDIDCFSTSLQNKSMAQSFQRMAQYLPIFWGLQTSLQVKNDTQPPYLLWPALTGIGFLLLAKTLNSRISLWHV